MLAAFVFWAAFLVQLLFYGLVFARLAFSETKGVARHKSGQKRQGVTVVVCARNEAENLRHKLPLVLQQSHPDLEVVVVDDGSTDETAAVLEAFAKKYSRLRIVSLGDDREVRELKGKKHALTQGIRAARKELLLLTDADCLPASNEWAWLMTQPFENEGCDIVLGYSPYKKQGGLLNMLIQYETVYTAMQYLSLALWGQPYMGVGRNLAYRKRLHDQSEGFAPHGKLPSGDDDLFVNRVANGRNTAVQINRLSFCISEPATSYGEWARQKGRHVSAGKHYAPKHIAMLFALYTSHCLFYVALLGVAAIGGFGNFCILALAARIILLYLVFRQVLAKLNRADLLFFVPLLDFLFVLYYLAALPTSLTDFSRKWDWNTQK